MIRLRRAVLFGGVALLALQLVVIALPTASACHNNAHIYHVRGTVTWSDGRPASGLDVQGVDTTNPAGPEDTCPGATKTAIDGNYEVKIHMHAKQNPSDHGDPVRISVLVEGKVVGSKTITANLRPSEPEESERFADGVDFVIDVSNERKFDIWPLVPYLGGGALAVAIAGIVIWDFRRVKAKRTGDRADARKGAKVSDEEKKRRAEARKSVECEACGARVRADRLDAHVAKVHPKKR